MSREMSGRFASPLSLLHEWSGRADQAPLHELVILGYTVDLSFLEQVAVSLARSLGARITVLGDAGQGRHDPMDVRKAGRSYIHGLVSCVGAFHPKLVLLIGEADVWMAVGSGNPTLSGWGANDELWTVVKSSSGAVHPMTAQAADWLRRLADTDGVAMTTWTAGLLRELAGIIGGRPVTQTSESVRLFDNLGQGFVDQLPRGPVDELWLYAPFMDPSGATIRALVEHFDPGHTVVALQPRWTSYNGDALIDALAGRSAELRFLEEKRPRHGKLIQWRIGDRLHGLAGSPNLSRSALLRSTADGGNCELAVLSSLPESLMPDEGASASTTTVRGRSTVRPAVPAPSLLLLGALVTGRGVEVTLARPQKAPVTVFWSPDGSPHSWRELGTVPPGEITRLLPPVVAGTAIRASLCSDGGQVVESPEVRAVNPTQCARRSADGSVPRFRREYTVEEVLTDPALADRFDADLRRLAEELPRFTRPRPAVAGPDGSATQSVIEDRWLGYLENCDRAIGPALNRWVHGPVAAMPLDAFQTSRWVPVLSSHNGDDDGGEEENDGEDSAEPAVEKRVPPPRRPDYRRWAGRWAEAVTTPRASTTDDAPADMPPILLRMLVAGIYVKLLAAGIWDSKDDAWRGQLARLTKALVPEDPDDLPDEARGRLCALSAVCMALLLDDAALTGGRPNDVLAAQVWDQVRPLIAEADPELGEDLLFEPVQGHARVVSRSALESLIDLAGDDDPLAVMKAEADAAGWKLSEDNGVWEVAGDFTNPIPVAGRVATLVAEQRRSAVVLAYMPKSEDRADRPKQWTLVIWRRPHLALVGVPGRQWRLYRVARPATPESRLKSGHIGLQAGEIGKPVPMRKRPPVETLDLIADCGFDFDELWAYVTRKVGGR